MNKRTRDGEVRRANGGTNEERNGERDEERKEVQSHYHYGITTINTYHGPPTDSKISADF
jgi:hypothetical protein